MRFTFTIAGRSAIAAALLGATAVGASAQTGNPADMVRRNLDNLPRERGAQMANEQAGEVVIETDGSVDATTDAADNPVKEVTVAAPDAANDPGDVAENFGWNMERQEGDGVTGAAGDAERKMDPDGDPITQEKTRLLDETGLIARQEQISEGILMMEQQVRYANAIGQVLSVLGPEARVEVAPGEFATFEGSPAAIKSRINLLRLRQELSVAENELFRMNEDDEIQPDEVESMDLQTRDDGSEYMEMSGPGDAPAETAQDENLPVRGSEPPAPDEAAAETGVDEERLEELERRLRAAEDRARRAEEIAQEASAAEAAEPALSLREVFGFAGRLTAVVDIDGERREVMTGESLPGGMRVLEVGNDYIRVLRDGEETRFNL